MGPKGWSEYLLGNASKAERQRHKEHFEYETKDNSKLRRFLLERTLPTSGTRDEMITRLETSSISYEDLLSEQLAEMLKQRQVKNYATGSKAVKIQRLRVNDKLERDTGTSRDSRLYGTFSALQDVVPVLEKAVCDGEHSSMTPRALNSMLRQRSLSTSGTPMEQVARLQNYDRDRLKKVTEQYDALKRELEEATGRTIHPNWIMMDQDQESAADYQIEQQAKNARPGKSVCDYKWQDSHWASRTERELRDICKRQDCPGYGPKAAMIKWLETGSLDYEDLYAFSLYSICLDRGLPANSTEKKVELVRRLKEDDEAEAAKERERYHWRDSPWASKTEAELIEICNERKMPGYGPKASMLKWLDTGVLGYEDECVASLKNKCKGRGISLKPNMKKAEIAARLLEDDKAKGKAP